MMLTYSRSFGVKINNKEVMVMVPLADMHNHSFDRQGYWTFDEKTKSFQIKANADIKKGDEINLAYGYGRSNMSWLYTYGFV